MTKDEPKTKLNSLLRECFRFNFLANSEGSM